MIIIEYEKKNVIQKKKKTLDGQGKWKQKNVPLK
jgi:hypothetical protein